MVKYAELKFHKVGFLASPFSAFSSNLIHWFKEHELSIDAVIFDTKAQDLAAAEIWEERTGGKMPLKPVDCILPTGAKVFYVDNHNSDECLKLLADNDIQLLVNAGTPRIIGTGLLNAVEVGILNVHPGILPKYRGCTCVEWSIYNDDPVGNTAHFMTTGIDEGPIICSEAYHFSKSSTYQDIRLTVYRNSFRLIAKSLQVIFDKKLTAHNTPPQPAEGQYFKPIPRQKHRAMLRKLEMGSYRFQQ